MPRISDLKKLADVSGEELVAVLKGKTPYAVKLSALFAKGEDGAPGEKGDPGENGVCDGTFTTDIYIFGKTLGRGSGNIPTNLVIGAFSLLSALPVSETNPYSGYNCVFGDYAAQYLQTGWGNNIQGAQACQHATHIQDTNALGNNVLWNAGNINTCCAFGAWAGWKLDSPVGVVAFGPYSFDNVVSANYSIALGFLAHAGAEFSMSGAIGAFASPTADKQIRIGRGDVSVSATDIVLTSDLHDKTDIEPLDGNASAEILRRIQPVSYRRDARNLYIDVVEYTDENGIVGKKTQKIQRDGSRAGKRRHWGVVAQQIEEIAVELGIDIAAFKRSTVRCPDGTEEDFCEIDYLQFIALLISGFQVLQKKVEEIEKWRS